MLFKNRATILIYLTDKSLRLASPEKNLDQSLTFPDDAILYGEITDAEKLEEALAIFFQKNPVSGSATIILSDKLVYKKTLEISEKIPEEKEKFFHYIPLKADLIAKLVVQSKDKIELFASSKALSDIVAPVAKSNNISVLSVTPVNAFEEDYSTKDLSTADVEDILKDNQTLKQYNFLQSGSPDEKVLNKHWVIAGTLISICIFIAALFIFGFIKNPFEQAAAPKTVLPIATPTVSPTPSTTPLPDKNSIKIQVLNGSGITGQAKKVSDAISILGYSNVITGNASESTASATTISYKNAVSKTFIDEIASSLKKLFSPVASSEANLVDFDVVIVTGK